MNKEYTKPELEIIELESMDVITASLGDDGEIGDGNGDVPPY